MSFIYETKAYASKTITVSNTALTMTTMGFTASQLSQAKRALITVSTAAGVRMTYDGTTPTAALGHLLIGTVASIYIEGNLNIRNLQFIRATGADSEVAITLETDLG